MRSLDDALEEDRQKGQPGAKLNQAEQAGKQAASASIAPAPTGVLGKLEPSSGKLEGKLRKVAGAHRGGQSRAAKLTPQRRHEIAVKAGKVRGKQLRKRKPVQVLGFQHD